MFCFGSLLWAELPKQIILLYRQGKQLTQNNKRNNKYFKNNTEYTKSLTWFTINAVATSTCIENFNFIINGDYRTRSFNGVSRCFSLLSLLCNPNFN